MSYEVELKFIDVAFDPLRETLARQEARSLGRYVERNTVFDTPERELRRADTLLRLRTRIWGKGEDAILTLKLPPQGEVPVDVKVADERETPVSDANAMGLILEGLGYVPVFRYEKMREEWHVDGVDICLDTLPFGMVAELEGEREAIFTCAARLGLPMDRASTETYHALNRQWRERMGLPPMDDFCFSSTALRELIDGL